MKSLAQTFSKAPFDSDLWKQYTVPDLAIYSDQDLEQSSFDTDLWKQSGVPDMAIYSGQEENESSDPIEKEYSTPV